MKFEKKNLDIGMPMIVFQSAWSDEPPAQIGTIANITLKLVGMRVGNTIHTFTRSDGKGYGTNHARICYQVEYQNEDTLAEMHERNVLWSQGAEKRRLSRAIRKVDWSKRSVEELRQVVKVLDLVIGDDDE